MPCNLNWFVFDKNLTLAYQSSKYHAINYSRIQRHQIPSTLYITIQIRKQTNFIFYVYIYMYVSFDIHIKTFTSSTIQITKATNIAPSTMIWNWTTNHRHVKPCCPTWPDPIAWCSAVLERIQTDRDCWRRRNERPRRCCSSRRDTIRVWRVSFILFNIKYVFIRNVYIFKRVLIVYIYHYIRVKC